VSIVIIAAGGSELSKLSHKGKDCRTEECRVNPDIITSNDQSMGLVIILVFFIYALISLFIRWGDNRWNR